MEVLISNIFIGLVISQDQFFKTNNVLNEYEEMKKEIKNSKS